FFFLSVSLVKCLANSSTPLLTASSDSSRSLFTRVRHDAALSQLFSLRINEIYNHRPFRVIARPNVGAPPLAVRETVFEILHVQLLFAGYVVSDREVGPAFGLILKPFLFHLGLKRVFDTLSKRRVRAGRVSGPAALVRESKSP